MHISKKILLPVIICCVLGLTISCLVSWHLFRKSLSLHKSWKQGLIRPEVISVMMPLPDSMNEQTAQKAFDRLTRSFEQQYPGLGIDLQIYADANAYQTALETEMPVVWMVSEEEQQTSQTLDLSDMLSELNDFYLTDLSAFETAVPLSFHVTAVYDSILNFAEQKVIPSEQVQDIENGSDNFPEVMPVLYSSSGAALIEHNPELSGTVRMIPVSENGEIPMQFSNYCCINPSSDSNHQKIGMLWISYLLSEEAQNILFAEHYGELPLHQKAFDNAVMAHQSFAALEGLKNQFVKETEGMPDAE